ncbi:MAG: PVC-type heme-binding CxxCH protein [Rubripirellula sp.]
MTGRYFFPLAIIWIALSTSLFAADDFKQPEPLEPEIAEASSEGVESMSAIRIPDGWEIQLFAAEPDIANVVAFDIDNRGRIFACETFRQSRGVTDNRAHDEQWVLADLAAETVQDRIDYHKKLLGEAAITYAQHDDRIRRIEDSDGDGKADQSYVVANGFNRLEEGTGAGVLVRGSDIYYTCIPKLWKLVDKDDNGVADERIVLSDGYGVRVAFRGHDMHGLVLGPDGRLYFSIGDRGYYVTTDDGRVLANPESGAVFRCELDGSGLEVFADGLRNPQELAFNDLGDLFSVDNNSDSGDMARIVHILEGGDSGWRMHYQYLPDRGPFNRDKIWEPLHDEQPVYIVPPIANLTDGPSGLAFYPGTGFGEALKDKFLICDFRGGPANSGIRSFTLSPDGAFYGLADDDDPIWTVLATDVAFGPDGGLYISDWVDGWNGLGKARMYRVTDPEHRDSPIVKEVATLLGSDWTRFTIEQLTDHLAHVDRRIRFEAQWELARRRELDTLVRIAGDTDADAVARLHSIWGADQIARQDSGEREQAVTSLRPLLEDADANVRAAAAKVAGEREDHAAVPQLRSLLKDTSPRVQYFALLSLANLRDREAFQDVVRILDRSNNTDPAIRHACVMYFASAADAAKIASLAKHSNPSVRRAAVVALRRIRAGELAAFLEDENELVVLEAARAIHDEPVPVAMNTLASKIDDVQGSEELIRRVLNANYRLGSAEAAAKLAEYAERISAPPEMRVEALEMLASWSNPDPRDRVLNAHRPLAKREAAVAMEALTPQIDSLMTAEASVREKTIEVASGLGIKKIVPMLVQRVGDLELTPEVRSTALAALNRLDPAKAVALAKKVKLLPATEMLLQALKVLAEHSPKESTSKFVEATSSRSMDVRQLAWDILASSEESQAEEAIAKGVQGYLESTLAGDVHLNVLEAAKGRLSPELQERLDEHGRTLAEADVLSTWLTALEGGNVENGRRIFFENTKLSCLRCHKVDRAGGEVGPNLTTIGKEKDRRYLLEAICVPDAQIAKGYETAVIANDLGQVFSGIVKAENDSFVELIQNDGGQVRILIDEIVARRKGKSSMPDDLTKFMSMRELRDIVAYLESLKVDPRAESDVE